MPDDDRQSDPNEEADDRFPSGPWTGYFLQKEMPGKHWMDMSLSFKSGTIEGAGSDPVGRFLWTGTYCTKDGRCVMTKRYIGRHSVFYDGYNEGRGIWGTWQIPPNFRGGFHIWPKAMGDLTEPELSQEADSPFDIVSVEGEVTQELMPSRL